MSNPVLNTAFADQRQALNSEPMSVQGAINKTLGLLALATLSGAYTWQLFLQGFTDKVQILMWTGLIGGLIFALAGIFTVSSSLKKGENPKAIVWLAPAYALFEGLALGGISAVYASLYAGIIFQAVLATFAVCFVMLLLFKTNTIRATEKFRAVLLTATLSVLVVYVIQIIASLFGRGIPLIFESGNIGIAFSLVVVAIASLNLIIDFEFIEQGARNLIPKNCEWYGALGLMITLVWLYLEVLRLLAKLNDRR